MPRVALFWEEAFPTVDAEPQTLPGLRRALDGFEVTVLGADALDSLAAFDLLVLPFGSAFPKPAWPQIQVYLETGGNLLQLGGAPFSVPCVRQNVVWTPEIRQTTYHESLRINQIYPVEGARVASFEAAAEPAILAGARTPLRGTRFFELMVRFSEAPDHPHESGSAGTRDAMMRPLLFALDAAGQPVAAPVVAIDRLKGPFAGGRWVFANVEGALTPEAIRRLAFYACLGATEVSVTPGFACCYQGELPRLTIHASRFGTFRGRHTASVAITAPDGTRQSCELPPLTVDDLPAYRWTQCAATLFGGTSLAPGLYTVEATLVDEEARAAAASLRIPTLAHPGVTTHRNGFWVYDERLMSGGQDFTTDADYLRRHGEPYPVLGTTYMASDVHRRFLFEPNPYLWDRDFAAIKEAGANLVRTGIWTGWRKLMLEPGVGEEGALRALDAFVLTARRHDMPLIFTFFAFLPEMWEGENPYLDPRSLAAQRDFIAAIIERYPDTPGLLWDLINEPSFCSPQRLWQTRPNYDTHERHAWAAWLSKQSAAEVRERWRVTPSQPLDLPTEADFQDRPSFQDAYPMKAVDYRLFAQEMFNAWVNHHQVTIQMRTPKHELITVGQDEGGNDERPSPQFHAEYVDFTSNHSWWRNDDLLWDSILAKTLHKPNLIEETGIMLVEELDGRHRRSEEARRDLLERKLALAIGGSAAGAVQWLWNTNVYMPSDNEVSIGFVRADGSVRPELEPFSRLAQFVWRNRARLEGREPEATVMLIPHSNMFSVRDLATPATKACVRVFHHANRLPLRATGEYYLEGLGTPRLMLLPAARVLRQEAWEALLERVAAGATLLVTGPIDADPYWRRVERLAHLGLATHTAPVAREEFVLLAGQRLHLTFGGEKAQRVDKAVLVDRPAEVVVLPHGDGKVIFAPLPFELADNLKPLAALYEFAIAESGLERGFSVEGADSEVLVRPMTFRDAVLYTFVSETDEERTLTLRHGAQGAPISVTLPGQRAALLFVDRATGAVLDRYDPTSA